MTQRRTISDERDEKRSLAHLQATLDSEEGELDDLDYTEEEAEEALKPDPVAVKAERGMEELSVEQIIARAESSEEWDIFEDIGAHLVSRGDQVKYSVKLNGEHRATIPHPCSYDWLQKKYGGGSYHVTLRSYLFSKKAGGGYLKSQSKMVANPADDEADADAPLPTTLAGVMPAPEKAASPVEMLSILQSMNEKARSEQRAEMERIREENRLREERLEREAKSREERLEREAKERESKRESEGSSTMMMLMKFMEQSSVAAREAANRQNEMLIALLTKSPPPEREDKKTDKLFDMLLGVMLDKKAKGDSLDPLELQKLLSAAEDKGYSRAKEIRELAQEEAARLSARMGGKDDDEDDEDEEPKEKSTTKMLLETIAPMISQFAQGAAQAQAQPQPVRRALPPQMRRPLPAPGPNPNMPARPPAAPAAPARLQAAPAGEHPVKAATNPVQPQRQSLNQVMNQSKPQAVKATMKPTKKEIVSETVVNKITADLTANFLTGGYDPEKTADAALASLADYKFDDGAKIDAAWLLTNFTLDEMKAVAKAKGMPEAINAYLERFYERVKYIEGAQKILEGGSQPASTPDSV